MPIRNGTMRDITVSPAPDPGRFFGFIPKGLNPGSEQDMEQLNAVAKGYASGAYDDSQIENFIKQNPATEVYLAPVIQQVRKQKEVFSNFAPAKPAEPFVDEQAQAFGLPQTPGLIAKEAQPAKADTANAFLTAMSLGEPAVAKSIVDALPNKGKDKGAYGGVQYAQDPKTGAIVPYIIDQESLSTIRLDTRQPFELGKDLKATVPMTPQIIQNPDGSTSIATLPNRGVPGQTPTVTPTDAMPRQQQVPDKEIDFFSKSDKDLQTIDLLLKATDPKATKQDKEFLNAQGINWDPNATGAKGILPNFFLQRVDEKGNSVRIAASDFQADKIYERYAGNLTSQEIERAKQWGVTPTDTNAAFRAKLANQKRVLEALQERKRQAYSKGYAPNPVLAPRTKAASGGWKIERVPK